MQIRLGRDLVTKEENRTNHGVYKIINTINNDCYIGSSSNLKSRRYKHFLSLKNDVHANKILQSSYKKHGKENFIWDIIKYVEYKHGKDKLKKRTITEASNYYNINKSKIGAVCQGKRNTCGGYKWSYN